MKRRSPETYEARARIAKALGHPTRLMLLDALRERPLCVCEMTELAGLDQSTVSKHLAILKQAGLVRVRKEAQRSIFSVHCTCLDSFFECLEQAVRENLRAQQHELFQIETTSPSRPADSP